MIDTLLNGRYQLQSELGRGGMGVVYRAHDTLLHRDVAVKVLSSTELGTEGRARLLHEARAAAQLHHPNVVNVHDAGESEGLPFIIMERLEGEPLHSGYSLEELLAITRQICAGLEHAHAHGIVHRDLKPENVIVAPDGTAVLTDFGLARSVASRLTTEGTIVGTVFYLAPELALGGEYDGRADLYALGVMLYELTTGGLPFVADDPVVVISQHLHAPVVPPRAKNDRLSPALDGLILRLLSKDPQDRPASAAEVLRALESPDILDGEAAPAQELSVLDRIVRGRLVGRALELGQARELWAKTVAGGGQTLLVSGEPGVGKTRLVREIVTRTEISGGCALGGACYHGSNVPYGGFAQIVRQALNRCAPQDPPLPALVLADLLTLVPDLAYDYPDVPPNPKLDPGLEQMRLFEHVVVLCRAIAEQSPLLAVIEDVHWADGGTLAMLRHLARRTRGHPVMLVVTYREVELKEARPLQELLSDLHRERIGSRIKLTRLTREQTREMLAAVFAEEITDEFLHGIYRETEGNPFFVEEVCRALVESGELYFEGGQWHRPDMEDLEIPQGVQTAVESRLEKLPDTVQETLRMAAILGREFEFEILAAALDLGEDALIEALETAEAAHMIHEIEGQGDVTFCFVHALVSQAIVESVRTLRRRRLHRRAAAAIEDHQPENYEALAFHCARGGDDRRALQYYTLAGRRAAAAYANQDAETYTLHALDLVEDKEEKAGLLAELGLAQDRQSKHSAALVTWRQAIDLYASLGNHEQVAHLYARSVRATRDAGDPAGSLAVCEQGLAAVGDAPESPGLAHLLSAITRAYLFNAQPDQALRFGERAIEMAERFGAVDVQVNTLLHLGLLYPAPKAKPTLDRALELAQAAGLLMETGLAYHHVAVWHLFFAGHTGEAIRYACRAAETYRRANVPSRELYVLSMADLMRILQGDLAEAASDLIALRQRNNQVVDPDLVDAQLDLWEASLPKCRGHPREALPQLRAAQERARRIRAPQLVITSAMFVAEALLDLGEHAQAAHDLEAAIDLADRSVAGFHRIWTRCLLARVRAQEGRIEEALELLQTAEANHQEKLQAPDEARLAAAWAHVRAAQGDWGAAWQAFEAAQDAYARITFHWYAAWMNKGWAEALLTRDDAKDRRRARGLLEEVLAEFGGMGADGYVEQIKGLLGQLEDGNKSR